MNRPSILWTVICALVMVWTVGADASASDKFSYDGQIRLRGELDLKSTDSTRHGQNFNLLRTRVGFKFAPSERAFVYVQLQDSRTLGSPGSGDLSATDNVDLHQAYFVVDGVLFPELRIKAGRFEINYGNQRVFGSVGWHNIGRSWEGGMISYRGRDLTIDLFNLKRMELDDENYNRDFDIVGLYGKIEPVHLDLFVFYEVDADSSGYVQKKLKRFNVGGYYHGDYNRLDFTAQTVFQFGEKPRDTIPDSVVQDISAVMAAAEIGYNFEGVHNTRIAVGIDYTSGDDGDDATKYKAYTNAYFTAHKFQGYMDYFTTSPDHGLIDVMLRGQMSFASHWTIRGDVHYFMAAEDYISRWDDSTANSDIGTEIDLSLANKSISGATITGGVSVFMPDDHFGAAGKEQKTGVWSYFMATVDF